MLYSFYDRSTNAADLDRMDGICVSHFCLVIVPTLLCFQKIWQPSKQALTPSCMQLDNFPGRVEAGLLAFVKAVEANPEVWIPLMAQLGAKPEARALGCEVTNALAESYCNETAEAFFLYISKQLHESSQC